MANKEKLSLAILNTDGKETDTLDLPEEIFGPKVNTDVIHQAIVMYQASLRQGTANTKTRSQVSGGGKKPWRQKGTGRSRQGSIRSPLWKKGGVVFGPHPRDFSYTVPKKIRQAALKESLNAKYLDKNILCVTDLKTELKKTKEFTQILKKWKVSGKILALLDGCDPTIERVSRNIRHLSLMRAQDVNAYDLFCYHKLIMTKTAFKNLIERIQK